MTNLLWSSIGSSQLFITPVCSQCLCCCIKHICAEILEVTKWKTIFNISCKAGEMSLFTKRKWAELMEKPLLRLMRDYGEWKIICSAVSVVHFSGSGAEDSCRWVEFVSLQFVEHTQVRWVGIYLYLLLVHSMWVLLYPKIWWDMHSEKLRSVSMI